MRMEKGRERELGQFKVANKQIKKRANDRAKEGRKEAF